MVGKYTSLRIRKGNCAPLRADRCLRAGSLVLTPCP